MIFPLFTANQDVCPENWQRFEDQCYRYFSTSMSWETANGDCTQRYGAQLASIHSAAEDNFVDSLHGTNLVSTLHDEYNDDLCFVHCEQMMISITMIIIMVYYIN